MSAVSSKRSFTQTSSQFSPVKPRSYAFEWLAILVVGALFFAAGVNTEMTLLLIPGFVGLVGGILYFNSLFWERVISARDANREERASQSVKR